MQHDGTTTFADRVVSRNIHRRRYEVERSGIDVTKRLGALISELEEIEAGRRRPSALSLLTLAKALDCRLSDFFADGSPPISQRAQRDLSLIQNVR